MLPDIYDGPVWEINVLEHNINVWRPWVKSTHHISHFNEINIISTNTKFEGSGVKKIMTISKPHKQEEIHFEVSEFVSVNFSHSKKLSFQ